MTDRSDPNSVMEPPLDDTMENLTSTLFAGEQSINSPINEEETMEINDRIETYLGITDSEKKNIFQRHPPDMTVSFQLCYNHYPIYDIKGTVTNKYIDSLTGKYSIAVENHNQNHGLKIYVSIKPGMYRY